METKILFDYGPFGKITAIIPEETTYEVYAKDKTPDPCSGRRFDDEGGGPNADPYCV